MRPIRTPLLIAALAALVALPAVAQRGYYRGGDGGTLRLRLGEFTPAGDNDYWIDARADFTGDEEDFANDVLGIDYLHPLGRRHSLMISASSWDADVAQQYRDFTDVEGGGIFHTTSMELTSLEAGLIWNFTDRNATISPYIGAGGGYYDWTLTEDGQFIDFRDLSIFDDRFTDNGNTFGWFWVAGVEVPLGNWRLFAEGRWNRVDDDLSGDFEGLGVFDLSGRAITFGAGWSL